jgi:ketosteroid isomerase-like protein
MSNRETVEAIYAAFGRGDIPFILDQLDDEVQWESWTDWMPQRAGVPWLEPRTGKAGVGDFFRLAASWDIHAFEVRDIFGEGQQVAAECVMDATPPSCGHFRDEELHLWTFGNRGKVVRFRHYVDTAKHIEAARGT